MALSKEVYKEFEDLVGAENISNDPAIMPAYFSINFGAVILPGNTEEVQSIVKLCNRHKLPFVAVSTGWMGMYPEDIIFMDLRRMNRIIEINEKHMYAVVEPYVISAQLQAELMKRGLNCNIKGAGSKLMKRLLFKNPVIAVRVEVDDLNHRGRLFRDAVIGNNRVVIELVHFGHLPWFKFPLFCAQSLFDLVDNLGGALVRHDSSIDLQ